MRKSKSMQELGYKAISLYLTPEEYQALRKICFDREITHSGFLRELLNKELKKEGYLKKESK